MADLLGAEFLRVSRALLRDEYRVKIGLALAELPPEAIWARPNESSNAIGNLLLHLAGNVRQWIVEGLGGIPGAAPRDRTGEFTARTPRPAAELLAHLDAVLADADGVLARLDGAALLAMHRIQSRDVSGLEAVYHVVDHFAMHTGQIILLAKAHAPGRIRFYEDEPSGQARPIWKDLPRP